MQYEATAGETITKTAEQMIALANKTGKMVRASFNGIKLKVKPSKKIEDAIAAIKYYYHSEYYRRDETRRNSPEAKRQAAKEAKWFKLHLKCEERFGHPH